MPPATNLGRGRTRPATQLSTSRRNNTAGQRRSLPRARPRPPGPRGGEGSAAPRRNGAPARRAAHSPPGNRQHSEAGDSLPRCTGSQFFRTRTNGSPWGNCFRPRQNERGPGRRPRPLDSTLPTCEPYRTTWGTAPDTREPQYCNAKATPPHRSQARHVSRNPVTGGTTRPTETRQVRCEIQEDPNLIRTET